MLMTCPMCKEQSCKETKMWWAKVGLWLMIYDGSTFYDNL